MARNIDRMKRGHKRRYWLHRRLDHNLFPIGHAAFQSARTVRPAIDLPLLIEEHLIMDLAARQLCTLEPGTNLHSFDGLDRHHRTSQFGIQPPIPLDMTAKTSRQATHNHLKDAAQRIAGLLCLVNADLHCSLCRRIITIQLRIRLLPNPGTIHFGRIDRHTADIEYLRHDLNTQGTQKGLAYRANGYAHSRLTSTGTFKDIPDILPVIFFDSRKVSMTRTGCRNLRTGWLPKHCHAVGPIRKILIDYPQCHRTTQCLPKADSRNDLHLIPLNLHAATTARPLLTAGHIPVNGLHIQLKTGRQSLKNCSQTRAMRFTGSHKT